MPSILPWLRVGPRYKVLQLIGNSNIAEEKLFLITIDQRWKLEEITDDNGVLNLQSTRLVYSAKYSKNEISVSFLNKKTHYEK